MQGTGGAEMQMARDLSLLAPEIAVLLTAVGALVFEMLRLPRVALPFTVVGFSSPPASPCRCSAQRRRSSWTPSGSMP